MSEPARRFRFPAIPAETAVMAVLLLMGIGFAWLALRPSVEDRRKQALAELQVIGRGEAQAVTAFQQILAATEKGSLSSEEAADRIERDVLPVWRKTGDHVAEVRNGPLAAYFPKEVETFFRLRQEAWEKLVVAAREDDPLAMFLYKEKWEESEKLGERLRGRLPADPDQS